MTSHPFLTASPGMGYILRIITHPASIHTTEFLVHFFAFPTIYRQHPILTIRSYDGLSRTLRDLGYYNIYFTTHDGQFDNAEGFLRSNAFDRVISQSDYPRKEIKTALGVPDDYMFRHAIPIFNELSEKGDPFFAALCTTSDHAPWFIPDYFTPTTKKTKHRIVEYADWSIRQFIQMASKCHWFKNTIFVFTADHGAPMKGVYETILNYFHSPLLFYAPNIIKEPATFHKMSSQVDIYPTIMGMINQEYINNSFGIDLLRESRPYAIINDDNKIGILDSSYFCIVKEQEIQLFKYRTLDRTNYYESYSEKADSMADYARAQWQVFQHMILNKTTSIEE